MSNKVQPFSDVLAAELAGLLRQQWEALEDATFISMDEAKREAFEQRRKRIEELSRMLVRQAA